MGYRGKELMLSSVLPPVISRAAGTAPAGQAKTGPLVDRTILVMVVNIKKLPTCSTVNIGGCGYKVGVVSKNFQRACARIFILTTSKLLPAALISGVKLIPL